MASQFDSVYASAVDALMGLHGGSVTRWPHGHEDESEVVTAMWAAEDTGERDADNQSRRVIYKGVLTLLAGQDYDKSDSWLIDGWRYQVVAGGHETGGLRYLRLERTDKITTSRTPGVL